MLQSVSPGLTTYHPGKLDLVPAVSQLRAQPSRDGPALGPGFGGDRGHARRALALATWAPCRLPRSWARRAFWGSGASWARRLLRLLLGLGLGDLGLRLALRACGLRFRPGALFAASLRLACCLASALLGLQLGLLGLRLSLAICWRRSSMRRRCSSAAFLASAIRSARAAFLASSALRSVLRFFLLRSAFCRFRRLVGASSRPSSVSSSALASAPLGLLGFAIACLGAFWLRPRRAWPPRPSWRPPSSWLRRSFGLLRPCAPRPPFWLRRRAWPRRPSWRHLRRLRLRRSAWPARPCAPRPPFWLRRRAWPPRPSWRRLRRLWLRLSSSPRPASWRPRPSLPLRPSSPLRPCLASSAALASAVFFACSAFSAPRSSWPRPRASMPRPGASPPACAPPPLGRPRLMGG